MEWKQFSAKTVADAVLEAAVALGTTRDNIDYDVIQEPKSGFLGIGSKEAIIKACVKVQAEEFDVNFSDIKFDFDKKEKKPEKQEKKAEKKPEKTEKSEKPEKKENQPKAEKQQPKQEKKEKPAQAEKPQKQDKPVKEAKEQKEVKAESAPKQEAPAKAKTPVDDAALSAVDVFLKEVFAAMELEVQIKVTANNADREINIELSGDDMGVLIGKRGQTLDSLQYLASLVANKGTSEYIRVKVDTENYRERRKDTLENLAKNIAFKVKRTRKEVALEPMNPYERRVIHSALQNDKFVSTHSEGEEPYRHVVVTLKEGVKLDNYGNRRKGGYNRNRRGGNRRRNNNQQNS